MSKVCVDCGTPVEARSERCRKCAGAQRRGVRERHNGYQRVFRPGHELAAADGYILFHRAVLHDAGIEIPDGFHVHHRNGDKRDNRLANLAVVSPSEHARLHNGDAGQLRGLAIGQAVAAKRRREKTHCPHGHAYDEENTRVYQGRRFCRACSRARNKQRRAA
jgi:hypothetical protein